ncbi:hypothetical protein CXG81DRAFT_14947 [Caulochytrium protostelioides]|uniref:Vacuolar protein sorting 55 n=1 Tax=Caulochytrium protostelioides TaxID=1555241 RepID=A0A4P9WW20_9FUNG|nr:vacuolar protein sorting 55 [Caulochytrium protostelioides]RKO99140.1 hypothetical protein CXG81DRAFT_14947 [Caulochytrium protostelioides]|eukprot:RKO99140.1 hypothetical protein CXG81DRAFT_14947 [Caulochytrium protostelioides]
MAAGMKTIIALAFFLALGIFLTILSCALFNNWLPLLVILLFLLAPFPNRITRNIASVDPYSLGAEESKGALDTGYFITSMFLVSGIALPMVLTHAEKITSGAMNLAIMGGILVYGTIVGYIHCFLEPEESTI